MMMSQRKSIVLLTLLAFFVIRITAMLILRGLRIMVSIIKRSYKGVYYSPLMLCSLRSKRHMLLFAFNVKIKTDYTIISR